MRTSKQRRLELLLLFTTFASTMLFMQKLWNQTECDQSCRVMREMASKSSLSNGSSSSVASLCSNAQSNLYDGDDGHSSRFLLLLRPFAAAAAVGHRSIPSPDASAADDDEGPSQPSIVPPSTPIPPFCRFEDQQPKLLAIVTYQRCGSTFFGSLFNRNQNAFYMFEPLDSLYSSLYGTKMGWNVPSDIANHRNGTLRVLPDIELDRVFEFLQNVFSCRVSSLPTETLVHPYIYDFFSKEFFISRNYVQCVKKQRRKIDKCKKAMPWSLCGGRFGEMPRRRLDECRRLLDDTDDAFRGRCQRYSKQFDDYRVCRTHLRSSVDARCSPMLAATCQSRQLRVIKLVRASMESMAPLLDALPNFRVVHLVRDPRAVALSRKNFDSSARGLYTEADKSNVLVREATLYCNTVVRDVEIRRQLETRHPGKIYPIIYDDMVRNLKGYSQSVYQFLDANGSMPVMWIKQITALPNVRRALVKATRWQKVLSTESNAEIVKACRKFFQLFPYNWPKMT